jgi:hypothetical protein
MLAGGLYERTSGAAGQPLAGYRRREPERTDWLMFALHPVPTSTDVVAILDRIVRRIARRLAADARDDAVDEGVDVLAQVQADAAATWRSPREGNPTVRGVKRLHAWCEGYSLHAEVVIADHYRAALERLWLWLHAGPVRSARTMPPEPPDVQPWNRQPPHGGDIVRST